MSPTLPTPRATCQWLLLYLAAYALCLWLRRSTTAQPDALFWTVDVLLFVGLPLLLYAKLPKAWPRLKPREGQRAVDAWAELAFIAVVAAAAAIALDGLVSLFAGILSRAWGWVEVPRPWSYLTVLDDVEDWAWPLALYLSLSAAAAEELYFRRIPRLIHSAWLKARESRGPLPTWLRRTVTGVLVVGSSLLFGALHLHWGVQHALYGTLIGAAAMGLYRQTNNLWLIAWGHFCIDMRHFAPALSP